MGGDQNNLHPNYKMSSGHATLQSNNVAGQTQIREPIVEKNISCEKSISILQLVLSSRYAVAFPMVDICAIDLEDSGSVRMMEREKVKYKLQEADNSFQLSYKGLFNDRLDLEKVFIKSLQSWNYLTGAALG